MKNIGSYFEYESERNEDLMKVFREVRVEYPDIPLHEVYRKVVDHPSERFWVSEERASIIVSRMLKGNAISHMNKTKYEMYSEIMSRVIKAREIRPNDSLFDITFDIVNSSAPKFYLTPGSAKVIIHKIKHKWHEERKRKLLRSRM